MYRDRAEGGSSAGGRGGAVARLLLKGTWPGNPPSSSLLLSSLEWIESIYAP